MWWKIPKRWEDGEDWTRARWIFVGRIWRKEWRRKSWTSTKVEESKKGAFKGRGNPLEWKRVQNKKMEREDCWARFFSLFAEYILQRRQSKQQEQTEEEEDLIKKIDQKEGWMPKTDGGSRSCWRKTLRKH